MRRSDPRRAALVVLALAAACGGGAPPRLEVGASTVAPDDRHVVAVRVDLRNAGDRALLLDGVVPACGCTTVAPLPNELAPAATTSLALACRAPRAAGRVVRATRVRSSDPASPDTAVPVALDGVATAADPPALYFGYVAVGDSVTRDVVLASAVAPAVLPPAPAGFAIEPLPPRADGATGLRMRFTPSAPGVTRARLDFGPNGTLAATGVGYRDVLAFPAELVLPAATGARSLGGVTLMGLGVDPLEITRVEYPPGLAGELRTVVPGRQFRLVLRTRGGDAGGAIRLHTDSSDEPTVTIPIHGARS